MVSLRSTRQPNRSQLRHLDFDPLVGPFQEVGSRQERERWADMQDEALPKCSRKKAKVRRKTQARISARVVKPEIAKRVDEYLKKRADGRPPTFKDHSRWVIDAHLDLYQQFAGQSGGLDICGKAHTTLRCWNTWQQCSFCNESQDAWRGMVGCNACEVAKCELCIRMDEAEAKPAPRGGRRSRARR